MLCWSVIYTSYCRELVILYTDYPILASKELLTAADGLKLIEPDNQLILIVDALGLATEAKNLTVAKEKILSAG